MQNRDKRRLINEDEFNENEQRLKERERETQQNINAMAKSVNSLLTYCFYY